MLFSRGVVAVTKRFRCLLRGLRILMADTFQPCSRCSLRHPARHCYAQHRAIRIPSEISCVCRRQKVQILPQAFFEKVDYDEQGTVQQDLFGQPQPCVRHYGLKGTIFDCGSEAGDHANVLDRLVPFCWCRSKQCGINCLVPPSLTVVLRPGMMPTFWRSGVVSTSLALMLAQVPSI